MSLTIIKPAYPEADPRIITYAEQAAAGRITVCKKVRRICEIFLDEMCIRDRDERDKPQSSANSSCVRCNFSLKDTSFEAIV